MELIAKGSFYRNLADLNNRKIRSAVKGVLRELEQAKKISEIKQLKKLKEFDSCYRIKIADDYRMRIIIRGNKIWLTCFGHRSSFYKKFP